MRSWIWRDRYRRARDWLFRGVADRLPRRVVYFALIRAWAYATTGKYGTTLVREVAAYKVVERWERTLSENKNKTEAELTIETLRKERHPHGKA